MLDPASALPFLAEVPGKVIVDLGCGDGQHSLPLAQLGYDVIALDLDPSELAKLTATAVQSSVAVQAVLGDLREFRLEDGSKTDVLISISTVQYLDDESAQAFFDYWKEATNADGIHIVVALTVFNEDQQAGRLMQPGELASYYRDWDIGFYEEYKMPPEQHDDGPLHVHAVAAIIASNKNVAS